MSYLLWLGLQRFEDYSGIERGAHMKLLAGRAGDIPVDRGPAAKRPR